VRRFKFYLSAAFLLATGAAGLLRYPAPLTGGTDLLLSILLLFILCLDLCALGRALLRPFGLLTTSLGEELAFSFGLGTAALSFLAFLLGQAGLLNPWVAYLLLGACAFALSEHLEHFLSALPRLWTSRQAGLRPSRPVLFQAAVLWTSLVVAALALAPPIFYDTLLYHLALPQVWAAGGQASPVAGNLFSWLPGAGELAWTFCLLLHGPQLALLFNLACGFFLGLALLDAGQRFLPGQRDWLVPAFFFCQPLAALAFGLLDADGLTALHSFLALYAFLRSIGEGQVRLQRGWMRLAALLAGASLVDKPVAALGAAALLVLSLFRLRKEPALRPARLWAVFVLLAVLPLLPWMVRNGLATANPVYPFGVSLGRWEIFHPASRIYAAHLRGYGLNEGWLGLLSLPFLVTFHAERFGNGGPLSPLYLGLTPLLVFSRLNREMRYVCALLGLALLAWVWQAQVLRYLIPLLPAASLLAASLASSALDLAASRGWSFLLEAVLGFLLLAGAAQTTLVVAKDFNPVRVALGLESHWAYLERKVSYASVAEWAEAKLDPGERTLFLGESRTAYWPGPTLASTVFEPNPLAGWLERSPDAASLAAQARRSEVSYVLVNQAEWKRIESSDGPHYQYAAGPGQARVLSEWMGRWLQLLVTRDGCTLYRLKRAA
jgi:hypothetical protein